MRLSFCLGAGERALFTTTSAVTAGFYHTWSFWGSGQVQAGGVVYLAPQEESVKVADENGNDTFCGLIEDRWVRKCRSWQCANFLGSRSNLLGD
jgi:hypothetical protein